MKCKKVIKQQGIGLLELMLSLAIISVLLVMATRYYQSAHNSSQVNSAIGMVQATQGAVANYVIGNSPSTISVANLCTQGYLPTDFCGTTAGVNVNPWGGNLTAEQSPTTSGVQIDLTSVPGMACGNLISKFGKAGDTSKSTCNLNTQGTFTVVFTG